MDEQVSLSEINRRLLRIEERLDRAVVQQDVYQAEKSAAIEARMGLEARLKADTVAGENRIKSLESSMTWLVRLLASAFVTGIAAFIYSAAN